MEEGISSLNNYCLQQNYYELLKHSFESLSLTDPNFQTKNLISAIKSMKKSLEFSMTITFTNKNQPDLFRKFLLLAIPDFAIIPELMFESIRQRGVDLCFTCGNENAFCKNLYDACFNLKAYLLKLSPDFFKKESKKEKFMLLSDIFPRNNPVKEKTKGSHSYLIKTTMNYKKLITWYDQVQNIIKIQLE